MYEIIPLIIILVSFLIILIIIIRKFPALAVIDVDNLPEEKQAQTKHKIIEERIIRDIRDKTEKIAGLFIPIWKAIQKSFRFLYTKILQVEHKYIKEQQEKKQDISHEEKVNVEQKVRAIFDDIEELKKDEEKKVRVEKRYIEIISLDPKNIKAYRGLGDFYFNEEDYDKAKETFLFAVRLAPKDDEIFNKLGEIADEKNELEESRAYFLKAIEINDKIPLYYLDLGILLEKLEDYNGAFDAFTKAVELEPNNPKNLDYLLEISIIIGNREKAQETYERLAEVNSENQKLGEFKQRIEEMKKKRGRKARAVK